VGKEGEAHHRRHKHSPRKRRNGGTPVGLKEGAVWHVDLLLGNDREISSYTTAVIRWQPVNSNRGMVFSVWSMPRC
jgi:hypothetical protein